MTDPKIFKLECELRDAVNTFLTRRTKQRRTLVDAINDLKGCRFPAFIFGGALRDLMLRRRGSMPRDLDIVVEDLRSQRFDSLFSQYIRRRTRFGGYHLNVHGWKFDLWPLRETWAFRENLVRNVAFENLPKTTFLNIEAIVVRLDTKQFRAREVYSHGFFEALLEKKLEVNLEENPFPKLCVLRALTMAARFNFAIGPRLTRYIVSHSEESSPEELFELQWSHYKRAVFSPAEFHAWLKIVRTQLRSGMDSAVRLPLNPTQPELWPATTIVPSRKRMQRKPVIRWYEWKSLNLWET